LAYLKDELSPPLSGLYLSIPACISPEIVPEKYKDMYLSREQNKDAPSINASSIDIFESKSIQMSIKSNINNLFARALQARRQLPDVYPSSVVLTPQATAHLLPDLWLGPSKR
jgi:hypothetical protein